MGMFRSSVEEKEKADSLSRSYSDLNKLSAGKHLASFIERIIYQAQKDEDSVSIKELTSNEIAFYRGIRYGMNRLKKEMTLAYKGGQHGQREND